MLLYLFTEGVYTYYMLVVEELRTNNRLFDFLRPGQHNVKIVYLTINILLISLLVLRLQFCLSENRV